jgi:hypothetical protein
VLEQFATPQIFQPITPAVVHMLISELQQLQQLQQLQRELGSPPA